MRLAHIPENADYKFHWNVYSGKKKKKVVWNNKRIF